MTSLKIVFFKGYFNLYNMYILQLVGVRRLLKKTLICSIGMQNADFMSNMGKMINCCHFSVAQTVISNFHFYQ